MLMVAAHSSPKVPHQKSRRDIKQRTYPPAPTFPASCRNGNHCYQNPAHRESAEVQLMWNPGSFQPLVPRTFGLPFHINCKLCTGAFSIPVGDVGNWCPHPPPSTYLSNHPELHSPVLENPPPSQISSLQSLRKLFHFSCHNYGGYCLFFYLPILFHPYPVAYSMLISQRVEFATPPLTKSATPQPVTLPPSCIAALESRIMTPFPPTHRRRR